MEGLAFHVHHDILTEWCFDFDERVEFIKQNKPADEIELRLKLFKVIPPERLPVQFVKARAVYDKARAVCVKAWAAYVKSGAVCVKAGAVYDKAWAVYDKAGAVCVKAGAACEPQIEELHKELCPDCPWDGKTIFPNKKEGNA